MKPRRIPFPTLLLLLVAVVARAQTGSVDEHIRHIENGLLPPVVRKGQAGVGVSLLERMRHYGAPGLSIAVINDGKVEWARGYGVTESGGTQPVTATTLFQAGSISKPVAAMG